MRAKLVNEGIKHLSPKSEEEISKSMKSLPTVDKLQAAFENNDEELVKLAITEDPKYYELCKLFLENPTLTIEASSVINEIKFGRIVRDADTEYLLDFIKEHKIKYKIIDSEAWPVLVEYTGKARSLIKMLLEILSSDYLDYIEIDDLMFELGLEK